MTYQQMINKLQRLSVSEAVPADARRLAVSTYQAMTTAQASPRTLMGAESYFNKYGAAGAAMRCADVAALEDERRANMARAEGEAARFIAAWGL